VKNFNKILVIFLNILIAVILIIYLLYSNINQHDNWALIISLISIFTLIVQIGSQRKIGYGIYDFVIYFFVFSHLFMFGNIYLIAIDKIEYISWTLIFRYDVNTIIDSASYILMYLQVLNLGIVFFTKSKSRSFNKTRQIDQKLVKNIGVISFILALPFRIYIDIKNVLATQSLGSYYALGAQSGFADDLAILFVPSILMLLNSSISKKYKNIISILFILYSVLIMILTGDRRYQVIGILIYTLNYFYINKIRIKPLKIAVIFFSGVIFMNLIMQISAIRQSELVSPTVFFAEYGANLFSLDFIYKIFAEFGISFITVVIALKNIPLIIPFQKGFSFIGAIPSIFPIGWLFPDFFKRVSIFRRLNDIEGYPVGASLPGELYANFGWMSLFIAFIIGIFASRFLKFSEYKKSSSFRTAQYFSAFYVLINIVRGSFLEVTRSMAVVVIIPYVIYHLLKSVRLKTAD
jgi:hypothetical protein